MGKDVYVNAYRASTRFGGKSDAKVRVLYMKVGRESIFRVGRLY